MNGPRLNAADHDAMVHEHEQFTDKVGDALIRIQDEAYKLGHARARAESAALATVVQEALDSLAVSFGVGDLRVRVQAAVDALKVGA